MVVLKKPIICIVIEYYNVPNRDIYRIYFKPLESAMFITSRQESTHIIAIYGRPSPRADVSGVELRTPDTLSVG